MEHFKTKDGHVQIHMFYVFYNQNKNGAIPTLNENFREYMYTKNYRYARIVSNGICTNEIPLYTVENENGATYINGKRKWGSINNIIKQQDSEENI